MVLEYQPTERQKTMATKTETLVKETQTKVPTSFIRDTGPYPAELRRQLWPLCCGASILSGLKDAHKYTEDELTSLINRTIDKAVPDLQVFAGEHMMPMLTFLTLNSGQMGSDKIMNAVKRAGFVKIGEGKPRGSPQGFYVRDKSDSFHTVVV